MTWKEAVLALAAEVESWVSSDLAKKGHMVLHQLDENPVAGEPLLEIEVHDREILRLEPAAFSENKLPTSVHLYAYPTLRRVVIVGPFAGKWEIQTGEGVPMNFSWTQEDFIKLLTILATPHAA